MTQAKNGAAGAIQRIDFGAVADAALNAAERLVSSWLPGGKRAGHEWQCGSLSGEPGNSLSVNLKTGAWADFATDDRGGDLISLLAAIRGTKQGEAAREIARDLGLIAHTHEAVSTKAPQVDSDAWRDAGAWPVDGPPAPVAHLVRGAPAASWAYHDKQGGLLGYVHRFVNSSGGKEVLPCVWSVHPKHGLAWKWRGFSEPRPLYRLPDICARPEITVLVVEGEKCADAAHEVVGDKIVVTTWPGGCKAWAKADWSSLTGRKVILWPDVDAKRSKDFAALYLESEQPGVAAMLGLARHLKALDCDVRIVDVPAPGEVKDGYDVADVVADAGDDARGQVIAWLRRLKSFSAPTQAPVKWHPNPSGAARAGREVAEPQPWHEALITRRGELVRHVANIVTILGNDERWRGCVAFDELEQATVKLVPPPYAFGRTGEWESEDDTRTSVWLAQVYRLDVTSDMVTVAVETLARERRFNPIQTYLRSLEPPTDAQRHIDTWLIQYAHVVDTPYTRAVSRLFMRGMVRRAMEPGCKFDYCLVLEGAEGLRKSTMASVLGGQWSSDVPLDLGNNREASIAVRGKWVIEFSEMESVTRVEAHLQKSFLSRCFDQYRELWAKRNIRVPRQCVFVGTTNESEYIKEGQGARRFWPVVVGGPIDIEGLRKVMPRLLAEAMADFNADLPCHPSPEEQDLLFRPEQMKRVQQESLIDALHDWVLEPTVEEVMARAANGGAFSLADAAFRCLKISYAQLTRDLQTRIGKALGALGCERIEKRNGMTRYWYKPPKKAATSSASTPAQHQVESEDDIPF